MADMLCTPSELASFLQKNVYTATATLALEAATGVIQAAVGQRIVRVANDTVVIDQDHLDSGLYLRLPEVPVVSVGAVLVGATAVTDFTAQLSRGRLYRTYGWQAAPPTWPGGPGTVTVTYTHGYAVGDQRLQFARTVCLSLAAAAYENPAGVTREQSDDYAVQYEAATARLEATSALASALRRRYGRPGRSVLLVKG